MQLRRTQYILSLVLIAVLFVVYSEARGVQTSFKFLAPPVIREAPKKLPAINQFNIQESQGIFVIALLAVFAIAFFFIKLIL